jgi:menaquinone-specific isochorismate synthase
VIDNFRNVTSHRIIVDFDRARVAPSLSFIRLGIYPAYYWRERDDMSARHGVSREVIGLGSAAEFDFYSLRTLKDFLYHYEGLPLSVKADGSGGFPPLFVTVPFDCNVHSSSFVVPARIVVPKTAIVRNSSVENGTTITLYNTDGDFSVAKAALAEVEHLPRMEPDFSEIVAAESLELGIDLKKWGDEFRELERRFALGELEKVVLAHQFRVPNVRSLGLTHLLRPNEAFGRDNRFRFLVASSEADWLYSRSPERLLSVEGTKVMSEALGGTLKAGECGSTEKLDREHSAIVDQIDHDFRTWEIAPQWGGRESGTLDLGTIQHLWHPVHGTLPPSVTKTDLLFALHPTPAVCGLPKQAAVRVIEEFELFDRRLYGAPLGVIHNGSWDFVVGLRTVFSADNYFNIPIGVGIVSGSRVDQEVAEIYAKLRSC